jgi:hypothetical protein
MGSSVQFKDCVVNFEKYDESVSPFEIVKENSEENIYALKVTCLPIVI